LIPQFRTIPTPVIGMLHLQPLPGAPRFAGNFDAVREAMLADALALADGGVHGLMLENFGDNPFYPRRVPACVIANMTALAAEVRRTFANLPLGINVLRNDGRSALAIAQAVGAAFIRVNVLCGARVTDQGVIQGIAHHLLRDRSRLGARAVAIMADIDVKHSAPLGVRAIDEEVRDLVERGGADAVIVSGAATGCAVDLEHLAVVRQAAGGTPVWVGSGASAQNLGDLRAHAQGFIVGSALKHDGEAANPVDPQRVEAFMRALSRTP
jgi:hypothetical protein